MNGPGLHTTHLILAHIYVYMHVLLLLMIQLRCFIFIFSAGNVNSKKSLLWDIMEYSQHYKARKKLAAK